MVIETINTFFISLSMNVFIKNWEKSTLHPIIIANKNTEKGKQFYSNETPGTNWNDFFLENTSLTAYKLILSCLFFFFIDNYIAMDLKDLCLTKFSAFFPQIVSVKSIL